VGDELANGGFIPRAAVTHHCSMCWMLACLNRSHGIIGELGLQPCRDIHIGPEMLLLSAYVPTSILFRLFSEHWMVLLLIAKKRVLAT
jgi:hypothetical protein